MPSDIPPALELIKESNYASVIMITAVGYDYILMFLREIDYVWHRPFTRVSILFVVVRYVGFCWLATLALVGGAFVPGPVKALPLQVSWNSWLDRCKRVLSPPAYCFIAGIVVSQVAYWGFGLFLAAADLVMILRVYAMWNRSKRVLYILLFIYISQVIITFVWDGIYNNPDRATVMIIQIRYFTYCKYSPNISVRLEAYREIPRFILGTTLLILAVVPTFRQLVETYNVTKRWEINWAMKLLIREGALYFVASLLFNVHHFMQLRTSPAVRPALFLDVLSYPLLCAIMPRFIIGIHESYKHGNQNGWKGIDTGFRVFSQPSFSENATVPVIALGDGVVALEEALVVDGDVEALGAIPTERPGSGSRE